MESPTEGDSGGGAVRNAWGANHLGAIHIPRIVGPWGFLKMLRAVLRIGAPIALVLVGMGQARATESAGCQAIGAALSGSSQFPHQGAAQFNAGEIISVNESGTTFYDGMQVFNDSTQLISTTSSTTTATYTVPVTGSYNFGVYTGVSSGGATISVIVTCAGAAPTSTPTKPTPTAGASPTLNTQMATALPQAQIGNVMRRIDAGLAPIQASDESAPSTATNTASGNLTQSAALSMPGLIRSPSLVAYSDGESDFARFASLGAFSFDLGAAEDAAAGGPARQRLDIASSPQRMTVWGQGSVGDISNSAVGSEYSGQILSYTIGGDYRVSSTLLTGIAINYATSDITTAYNNGAYHENAYTLLPYAAWKPNDIYTLQMVGGVGGSAIDSDRSAGGITGDTNALDWFLSGTGIVRLNGGDTPWRIDARLGLLTGRRYVRAYTESDGTADQGTASSIFQFRPGFEVGRSVPVGEITIEPFARAEEIWDLGDAVNGSHTAVGLTGGMRAVKGPVFGSIEYDQELGRADYFARTITGVFGYHFELGGGDGSLSPQIQAGSDGGQQHVGWGIAYEPWQQVLLKFSMDAYGAANAQAAQSNLDQLATTTAMETGLKAATVYRIQLNSPF